MSLVISPCRSLCDWRRTRSTFDGQRLYACSGCGSQWVRTEPWTPRQADGPVPAEVLEEFRTDPPVSAAPGEGAAGTGGS